jgi:hypothetical protein
MLEPGSCINALGAIVGRRLLDAPGQPSDQAVPSKVQLDAVWTDPDRLAEDARIQLKNWPEMERRLVEEFGGFSLPGELRRDQARETGAPADGLLGERTGIQKKF